jgi:hypothetical protein
MESSGLSGSLEKVVPLLKKCERCKKVFAVSMKP